MLFSCKYVFASSASLVCMGTRRGHQISEIELQTVVICLYCWELNLGPLKQQKIILTTDLFFLKHFQKFLSLHS